MINFRLSQKICRSSMIQYLGAVFLHLSPGSATGVLHRHASAGQGGQRTRVVTSGCQNLVEYCIGFVLKIKHGSGMQWKIPLGFSYFNAHLVDFPAVELMTLIRITFLSCPIVQCRKAETQKARLAASCEKSAGGTDQEMSPFGSTNW